MLRPLPRELPEYDLLSPSFRREPYPLLHRLRAERPVYFSEQLQAWLVTRHADVLEGLTHPAISADRISPRVHQFPEHARAQFQPMTCVLSRWPLMLDRPEHSRFRPLLNRAMSRPVIHGFRPLVQRVTDELLESALAQGGLDFIAELALPLPLYVVSELLGVPRESLGLLKRCAVDIVNFFGTPPATYLPTAGTAMQSIQETVELLRPLVRARRQQPRQDLISSLLEDQEHGAPISEDDVIATSIMLVFAGFETTTNLLGNGLLLLLRHPEQLALLREHWEDPQHMRAAVDEVLRHESPVQRLSRMASADLTLHGQHIRQGELLFFMASAANRDPAVFPEPDRFDIRRDSTQHIAFGHWIHTCPGSTLAHLEAAIVFGELCRRVPRMRLLHEEPQWHENLSVRALKSLPVAFS